MFVLAHYLDIKFKPSRIVIVTPDTDVVVIACYQFSKKFQSLKEMWVKTGTKKKNDLRYISIDKICESLGQNLVNLLPALHSMTGCDSVSSFVDIGKMTAIDHLKNNIDKFENLKSFGDSAELDSNADFLESVLNFMCTL